MENRKSWIKFPWSRERLVVDGEPTRTGIETHQEVKTDALIAAVSVDTEFSRTQEQNRHEIHKTVLAGFKYAVGLTVGITATAVTGLAEHWFTESFALGMLAATLPPSWAAYSYSVKRAFTSRESKKKNSPPKA